MPPVHRRQCLTDAVSGQLEQSLGAGRGLQLVTGPHPQAHLTLLRSTVHHSITVYGTVY
jgi:hypothetical protein